MSVNQSDYERINRLVLNPLAAFYGKAYDPDTAKAIIQDLRRFPDQTLSDAVVKARQEQEHRPKIATLIAACRACQATGDTDDEKARSFYAGLQARGHRARERAAEFVERFERSPLARQAAAEGWGRQLGEYAAAAADFQAQLIERVPNPGYGNAIYRWVPEPEEKPGKDDLHPREAAVRQFLAEARAAAGGHDIRVTVPAAAIDHWRQQAKRREEAA